MRIRAIVALACIVTVTGCAQTRTVKTEIYRDRQMEIALRSMVGPEGQPLQRGYSHPASFEPDELKYLLASLKFRERGLLGWSEAKRVFTSAELYRLAPHLIEAFAKATPEDEISFRVLTPRPALVFYTDRITDGSMFVKDDKLNVVFGNIAMNPNATEMYEGDPRLFYAGRLWELAPKEWHTLVKGERGIHYNWVELDTQVGLAQLQRVQQLLLRQRSRKERERIRTMEDMDWSDWEPDEAVSPPEENPSAYLPDEQDAPSPEE
ncbi:MAG: hypothetical protein Kow0099_22000 [Candidatus Abyssubacteria bacterium]